MADAADHRPDHVQVVLVPWEWVGEPGEEWSGPIFGDLELPRVGGLGPRRSRRSRRLNLPAPGGRIFYRVDLPRAGIARLSYRFQDGTATQPIALVRGHNVIELRREDEPTVRTEQPGSA